MPFHSHDSAPAGRTIGGIPLNGPAVRWISTGVSADLSAGEMTKADISGHNVAIYSFAGSLYATDNVCTHAYALLTDGWLDEEFVECPLHGGRFDVTTGEAQGDPVTCHLKAYPVRIADGIVEIGLPL